MASVIQSTVSIYNAAGVVGDISFDSFIRAKEFNLYSNGTPNIIGNAFTVSSASSPNPSGAAPNGATATVGGTGVFAGILLNPKEYALRATAGDPLAPSIVLPDYATGATLLTTGEVWVNLPGPANVGDLVTYDPATGNLNSIAPTTNFTAAISTTTLTVSAVSSGELAVGQIISGAGITPGTYITALGTGKGYTGTYTINNSQTVSSEAMSAVNIPAPAISVTGSIAPAGSNPLTTASVLTVSAVSSGSLAIGTQIFGTGIPANTTIVSFGTGVGGTGTYNVNQYNLTVSSETITGPSNILVPNATVGVYGGNTLGGVTSIRL
jgi:hypothetical protein